MKLKFIATAIGQFAFMAKRLHVSNKEWDVVKSWYDGEIAYLDQRLGEVFTFLREEGLLENTLLIITADHGENFGEHGFASHHFNLYDSLLHVPLLISYPEMIPKGRKLKGVVSTVDIFPTIMSMLGIETEDGSIQGKSLYPFDEKHMNRFVCAECGKSVINSPWRRHIPGFQMFKNEIEKYDKGLKCLRNGQFKYILFSDNAEELYDVKKDPLETNDISSEHRDLVKHLRKQLESVVDISFFGPNEFPDRQGSNEMLQRLHALGYV